MRSLRFRLWVLWLLALLASVSVGLLFVGLYRSSTVAQVERAEAMVARGCDAIRDRYGFYVAGWDGAGARPAGPALEAALRPVIAAALLAQDGVEGGIWSGTSGSLAYAFPTYPGTGPKTDLPTAELPRIATLNAEAAGSEQLVLRRRNVGVQTLLLAACPLSGPVSGLTAWTMARVQHAPGLDRLRLGLGLLGGLVLGVAAWVTRLTAVWGRHVGGIERTLASHDVADLPLLARTGERELDRIVAALNEAGGRLATARERAAGMAARVAEAERLAALGRVTAGVAHEIRNPMAALRLRAENALAGDPARLRPALEFSLAQVARVDRLVGELLAMTQGRAPQREPVDLRALAARRAEEHRERAAAAGVHLLLEGDAVTARLDPELIGRALDNLLLNALRHTPAGGTVRVRVSGGGGMARLVVSDTGPGVEPGLRARLFEPFATGRADGIGLGLAIARELAQAHGGRLRLEAEGPGATFVLELPDAGDDGPA